MKTTYVTFTREMARAYREGRKRMTRRVMSKQPPAWADQSYRDDVGNVMVFDGQSRPDGVYFECPLKYGKPGDQIILGTTWAVPEPYDDLKPTELRPSRYGDARRHDALNEGSIPIWSYFNSEEKPVGFGNLRPARFLPGFLRDRMPHETLKIVRAERLHDMRYSEIRNEGLSCTTHDFHGGFCCSHCDDLAQQWINLWNEINKKRGYGWDSNPFVWVLGW